MTDTCHECGNEYKKVTTHWAKSSCEYPKFTERQHEVLTGLLMGDAWFDGGTKEPSIATEMIAKEFLEYLSNKIFPELSREVKLRITAEDNAAKHRKSGFRPNANGDDYSDIYRWGTIAHPEIQRYEKWYSTGEKNFPEDIKLTPTTLKVWYVCDGFLTSDKYPGVALCNEHKNKEKIDNMFREQGLTDYFWDVSDPDDRHATKPRAVVRFRTNGADSFFEHVGKPLPGFSYKWAQSG